MKNRIIAIVAIAAGIIIIQSGKQIEFIETTNIIIPPKPKVVEEGPKYTVTQEAIRDVSAYNAGDPAQTSGNPCISANGENVCNALSLGYGRCAANFVPFGTLLAITNKDKTWEHFCTVTDRMSKRYPNSVDIAMQAHEKERAINFGRQKLLVQVLKTN